MPALTALAADVNGHASEREQDDHDQGEDDQDLASRFGCGHQFTTIVAVTDWRNRPPASVGSKAPMSGTTISVR